MIVGGGRIVGIGVGHTRHGSCTGRQEWRGDTADYHPVPAHCHDGSGGIAPGLLPADADLETVLRDGDERELTATWDTFFDRETARRITADPDARPEGVAVFEHILASLAPVTAVQALAANRRLVELLTGRRWHVIRDAREAGASWADIGAALGMSRQSAHEWYQRKIEQQEQHVPEFHDTARSRAVLKDTDDA